MLDFGSLILSAGLAFAAQTEASSCETLPGVADLLTESEGRVMLVGGLPGSDLGPAFIDSLVCAALAQGETVVVALEQPASEQAHLDTYIGSNGDAAARQALLDDSPFWSENIDGRSSRAMFELVDQSRIRIAEGADLRVAAIDYVPEMDGPMDGVERANDFVMARNLSALSETADRVIAMVGNVSASRVAVENLADQPLQSIGSYSEPGTVYSVKILTHVGSSWTCRVRGGRQECGIHGTGANLLDGEPRVVDIETVRQSRYWGFYGETFDAFVLVGSPAASQPARIRSAAEE